MKKHLFLLILAATAAAYAEDAAKPDEIKPELQVNTAEPQQEPKKTVQPAPTPAEPKTIKVDAATLLANPDLLTRAMSSVLSAQNIDGIKTVLPIYEQWPQHDKNIAMYARALVAQDEGRVREAIELYRRFIAENPEARMVRWKLATALFEDRQNEAAADQFDRLQAEPLPEGMAKGVESYRKALRQRDSWKFNAGLNITREQNVNQAPSRRRLGSQLSDERCQAARKLNPNDDCFRGWTFPAPIDATAINYQIGADKKWSLADGWYITAGADFYGKTYPKYTRYNDTTTRVNVGLGHADSRNDFGVAPFYERRFYGNDPYSYSAGARFHWNRWQSKNIQTLSAVELGRLTNTRRARSDNKSRLISNSLVYYRNARQYWVGGFDFYQERNGEDRSDDFNRYSLRATWGQEWGKGLSTALRLTAATRFYKTPSFFSNNENRRDKEMNASLSLWHRAIHFKGITPRLTVAHNKTWSNDKFYEYGKTRMFVEFGRTF